MFRKKDIFEMAKGKNEKDIEELKQMILRNGKDALPLTLKNKLGNTLLMTAASYGNAIIVEALLQRYANPLIQNNIGDTALAMANRNKQVPKGGVSEANNNKIISLLETAVEKWQAELDKTPDFIYFTKQKQKNQDNS